MRTLPLVTLLLAAPCGEPRPASLQGAGVTVARVAHDGAPHEVTVTPIEGDFVLAAGDTRVLVGGLAREGAWRGGVLAASLEGMGREQAVSLTAPRLRADTGDVAVQVTGMRIVSREDRPALRIEGKARLEGRGVRVAHELTLRGDGQWLSWRTRVDNRGRAVLEGVRPTTRIARGGAAPFVPGEGDRQALRWRDASWMGWEGDAGAVAFASGGFPMRVRGAATQHGEARMFADVTARLPLRKVEPGVPAVWSTHLTLVPGNLAEAVRRLGWAQGRPFREVGVDVPAPPRGAWVEARTDDGPAIRSRVPAGGQVLLPLPPVRRRRVPPGYRLVSSADGHAESVPVPLEPEARQATVPVPEGGRVRVTLTDGEGRPLTGRVRLEGRDGTEAPDLGPDFRAAGAGDTVLAFRGRTVVPVPPGRYRVLATRGPEWTVAEAEVEVTETYGPHVRARLERAVDPGEWVGCDFHLHAAPSSDSEVSLEDRVLSLLAEGVRFAVPTDHNHVTDLGPVVDGWGLNGFGTVPGVEVSTWNPAFGHFNAYPYVPDPTKKGNGPPTYQRTTPADLFASLRGVGGDVIVQVNHPRLEPDIGYFDLTGWDPETGEGDDTYSDDFDVLEVFNGFDLARPAHVDRVFRDWLALLAQGRRVVANGSSDSHQVRFQWAGYPRTYVNVEGGDASDATAILDALRQGRAFVSSGPFLEVDVEGRGPGEVASVRDGVLPVRVRVRAAPWMEVDALDLFVGPELVRTVPLTRDDETVWMDGVVELPVPEGDSFVVARVRGSVPLDDFFGREDVRPLAFTNPVYLDVDGDGMVPWVAP